MRIQYEEQMQSCTVILVINSDRRREWSELEVKHNFVFIEGNHQHDGEPEQQP